MSTGEMAYLTMVLTSMATFIIVVLVVSIWSRGAAKKVTFGSLRGSG